MACRGHLIMTPKYMKLGPPKSSILDPFFMVFGISLILLNSVKNVLRKIVYHENKNVPLPCYSALRFFTFLHPFFNTYFGPLGVPRWVPLGGPFSPFSDPLCTGVEIPVQACSPKFHTLLERFGHFWVSCWDPKKGCFLGAFS